MDKVFTRLFWFRRAVRLSVSLAVMMLIALFIGTMEPAHAQDAVRKEALPEKPLPPGVKKLPDGVAEVAPPPTAAQLKAWHKALIQVPTPKAGCFTSNYPEMAWKEIACKTPPPTLYMPRIPAT